ncbi:MAG: type IV secretion system protein [Pseudomonadota bacterium]|jgi:type IV secretion system protein VirB5
MNVRTSCICALVVAGLVALPARAQFAVIDMASVSQLMQQMTAWQEQLLSMRMQLLQMQQTRIALTGWRGMERVLPLTPADRNYLPLDAAGLVAMSTGTGAYSALSASINQYVSGNAVLTPQDLAQLPAADVARLAALRQTIAMRQALMSSAYAHSSDRFTALGVLVDKIAAAPDAKAIADLQARIAAEQTMLQNENAKIATLDHYATAERDARELATREAIVKGHGRFASRFMPTNPVP